MRIFTHGTLAISRDSETLLRRENSSRESRSECEIQQAEIFNNELILAALLFLIKIIVLFYIIGVRFFFTTILQRNTSFVANNIRRDSQRDISHK